MKSFTTQILLMLAAIFFLMKGGIGVLAAAWKLVLPLIFLGGAYYFMRKALSGGLVRGAYEAQRVKNPDPVKEPGQVNHVIEICPHCLAEVGSCPKCKKKKF